MDKTKLLVAGGLVAAAFLLTRKANAATPDAQGSYSGLAGGASAGDVSGASAGSSPSLAGLFTSLLGTQAPAPTGTTGTGAVTQAATTYATAPAPAPAPAPVADPVQTYYQPGPTLLHLTE